MEVKRETYEERVSIKPSNDAYDRRNACGSRNEEHNTIFHLRIGVMTICLCPWCCLKLENHLHTVGEFYNLHKVTWNVDP